MSRAIFLVIVLVAGACGGDGGDTGTGTGSATASVATTPVTAPSITTIPTATPSAETAPAITPSTSPTTNSATTPPSTAPTAGPLEVRAGLVDEAVLGDPYLGPLTFVAPVDCSVPIEEQVYRGGSEATLSYSLGFTSTADGTDVSFDDMRVLELDGRAISFGEQALAALGFRQPRFVVNSDGLLVAITGTQEMLDAIAELDPEAAEFLSNPAFIAVIEESIASKYWAVWVGFWADWGSFEDSVEQGYIEGDDTEFVAESVGTTDAGLAVLRYTSVLEGPGLVEALGSVFESLLPAGTSQDEAREALATADGRMSDRIEVVTDPATLWPASTFYERDIELTIQGETDSQLETRRTVFDWGRSTCVSP